MARVNVEHKALTDSRFEMLGKLLGSNRYEALGRMLLVWHECQDRGSYILPEKLVGIIMGNANGGEWLVECDLAERVEGGVRIKGTEGRIEWLKQKRESGHQHGPLGAKHGAKGGRPKKGVKTGSRGFSEPSDPVSETLSPGLGNPPPPPPPAPARKTEDENAPPGGEAKLVPAGSPPPDVVPVLEFPESLDTTDFRAAWERWVEDRRKRKLKKLTPDGTRTQLAKLAEIGPIKAIACIEQSIANGWQGLFPDRFKIGGRGGGFQTHDDRYMEMMLGDNPGEAA